jgi:hypothetical protein
MADGDPLSADRLRFYQTFARAKSLQPQSNFLAATRLLS